MKSSIKIPNMNTVKDVNNIKAAIANIEGIIACQISKERKEVNLVYDNYFVNIEKIIVGIEDSGYTVI